MYHALDYSRISTVNSNLYQSLSNITFDQKIPTKMCGNQLLRNCFLFRFLKTNCTKNRKPFCKSLTRPVKDCKGYLDIIISQRLSTFDAYERYFKGYVKFCYDLTTKAPLICLPVTHINCLVLLDARQRCVLKSNIKSAVKPLITQFDPCVAQLCQSQLFVQFQSTSDTKRTKILIN